MNNNQTILRLNNALFSLGYARMLLGDYPTHLNQIQEIGEQIRTIIEDIYDSSEFDSPTVSGNAIQSMIMDDYDEQDDETKNHPVASVIKISDKAYHQTSNVHYQPTADLGDLCLRSIDPAAIVGASEVWLFNTKIRCLQVYRALTGGLRVTGSTIKNVSAGSYSRTLRKPEQQLNQLLADNPAITPDKIKSKTKKMTGRINKHCVIVRVQ